MAKLKSLRAAIGKYGAVSAGGIVEVDDATAKKLLDTKRFVTATKADIEAAQKAQARAMEIATEGAGPIFSAVATAPTSLPAVTGDLVEREAAVAARETELAEREAALQQAADNLAAREQALAAGAAADAPATQKTTTKK